METPTETELVRVCANLEATDPDLFGALFEVDPAFFRDLLEENPDFFRELLRENPLKDQAESKANFRIGSAISLRLRHSDYDTLLKRGVEPTITLAREMGLRVQGPVFLPSSKMSRSALLLVSGAAETLVRYTRRISSLPQHNVRIADLQLKRLVRC